VTGVCLSYSGFRAVRNLVGSPDLFGRELRMTRMNLADGLAAAAVMMMGEGDESRPLAVIENAEVEFSEDTQPEELRISPEEDLYAPLLSSRLRS
jgi:F420-0:gamma-glutamyl ligase